MDRVAAIALLLCVLCAAPASVHAQEWDPNTAVLAYSAALNAHDLNAALALFDEYGSATDATGRHFEGRAQLTEFLLANGFGSSSAWIATERLHIIANRAVWTFSCSCAAQSTEVRIVLNHSKISVFAVIAPPAPPMRRPDAPVLPWLIGLGLVAGVLAGWLGLSRAQAKPAAPSACQGRLLRALALYTPGGGASDRVELPAAAMTSLSNSDDSAGPWSR